MRSTVVADAVRRWTRQLIDLGGRNTLLYFRDLKVGTLDLSLLADSDAGADVIAGKAVRLSQIFREPETLKDAARRARALRAKAIENDEERGLQTLRLGVGLATWTSDRSASTPNAPVILYSMTLRPIGVTGEDFELLVNPEPEVNPTLQHLMETDFATRFDDSAFVDDDASPGAILQAVDDAYGAVPGFAIANRIVAGNFSYAKLPMVRDLERSQGRIEEHPLLAAVAGDTDARSEIIERHHVADELNLPTVPPPADEFLVLDADSSQSRVIARVVAGADLVVIGPPGTGKSQTISNLIATLVARGRSVLFVAEKRAAIEAVVNRLEQRELGDLVLDLHDGASDRRRVAGELSRALAGASAALEPDTQRLQRQLQRRRNELEEYADQLHQVMEPWGVSVFTAQNRILEIPEDCHTDVRFRGATLRKLVPNLVSDSGENLRRFVEMGGPSVLGQQTWAPAYAAGVGSTSEDVEAKLERLHVLRTESLPNLIDELERAGAGTGLHVPESLAGCRTFVKLLQDVNGVTEVFSREVFDLDLDELVASLSSTQAAFPLGLITSVFDKRYRLARMHCEAARRRSCRRPQ